MQRVEMLFGYKFLHFVTPMTSECRWADHERWWNWDTASFLDEKKG